MTSDKKIRDEKLNGVTRETAKMLALASGKIDQYENLTREEILTPNQNKKYCKLGLLILF